MEFGWLSIVAQLIFLEAILSIDNAAVLGAMVSALPRDEPIPWPKGLRFLAHPADRFLGHQRAAALKVGLFGAYFGRGLMLLLANFVIHNPWLRVLGALYLVKLAMDELGKHGHNSFPHETEPDVVRLNKKGFWSVVLAVELADLAFSLDNVVAAVALSDQLWVVMLGVAVGIVAMRFAAGIFSSLVEHEPILVITAYLLVLNIAVELLIEEFTGLEFHDLTKFAVSVTTIILSLLYAHIRPLQRLRPLLHLIAAGFWYINEGIEFLLRPFTATLGFLVRLAIPKNKVELPEQPLDAETGQ